MKVAVSYLKGENKKECLKLIDNSKADYIHVDLCDGKYVREKNFTIGDTVKLLKNSVKPLDVHLMCKEPIKYIDDLALLNLETITFHPLATSKVNETIDYIKSIGVKVGLAVNPNEKIDLILPYIDQIDEVLIMSVHPGRGGQTFIEKVLYKIDKLSELKKENNFITAIDGGINAETISFLENKDIDLIISGSYITDSNNYDENINLLKQYNN